MLVPRVSFVWTNGRNAVLSENGTKATASSDSCFVFLAEKLKTSQYHFISIEVNTGNNYLNWCHIGLGNSPSFPSLGNYYESQGSTFSFLYHIGSGKVNSTTGFPQKASAVIDLVIDKNEVSFSVDGVAQNGKWTLPEEVYLVCDPYHNNSWVRFVNSKSKK